MKNNYILFTILVLSAFLIIGCNTIQDTNNNNAEDNSLDNIQQQIDQQTSQNQSSIPNEGVVATVNGKEITASDLQDRINSLGPRAQQVPKKQILEQLINQELLFQEAKKEGFNASSEDAESAITEQLQRENITLTEYKNRLEVQNASYNNQLDNVRQQLITQEFIQSEINQTYNVSDEEARQYYERLKQQSSQELPPFEQTKERIKDTVKQQKQSQGQQSLIQSLRENAEITYE